METLIGFVSIFFTILGATWFLSSKISSINTWIVGHEKLDDDRHEEVLSRLKALDRRTWDEAK